MNLLRRLFSRYAGRRFAAFFLVAALVGLPAGILNVLCAGNACDSRATASSTTPFCSLPRQTRDAITQGTKEGRSGEILAVSGPTRVVGSTRPEASLPVAWPSSGSGTPRVPIVLWGRGIPGGTQLPDEVGLDDVAPTLAAAAGFERPHPGVRSGELLLDVARAAKPPRLLVLIALKGIGSQDIEGDIAAWPRLRQIIEDGAAATNASARSASADPVAAMTTLGTGGIPEEHGITGTVLRNDEGKLVRAWGPRSPINIIATLGDDLDEHHSNRSTIAVVGTDAGDVGLIGGRWYTQPDRDLVSMVPPRSAPAAVAGRASRLLRMSSLGNNEVPDLLGVALAGDPRELDKALGKVVAAAERVTDGAVTVAIAGTGAASPRGNDVTAAELKRKLERRLPGGKPLIEAMLPGVIYVDQGELARRKLSDDVVLRELVGMRNRDGTAMFADAFPAIAVTFGRFC